MSTSRIERFLSSLTDPTLPMEEQTQVFVCNENLLGEENGKNCTNSTPGACSDNLAICKNYAAACSGSSNPEDCSNYDVNFRNCGSNSSECLVTPPKDDGAVCRPEINVLNCNNG